jgi:hypothetical protein
MNLTRVSLLFAVCIAGCRCDADRTDVRDAAAAVVDLGDACDELVALEQQYEATEDPGPAPTTEPRMGNPGTSKPQHEVLPSLVGELAALAAVLDPKTAELDGVEKCRASLRAYASASRDGAACWGACAAEAGYARAVDCTETCVRNDAAFEKARRAARASLESRGRAWLASAATLPTKRASGTTSHLERSTSLELPEAAEPLGVGAWQLQGVGTVAPIVVSVAVDEPHGDFHAHAVRGEKVTLLEPVRETESDGRHLLARVGPDRDFVRDVEYAKSRDQLVVQILWDLPDGKRAECRTRLGLLDLDDALVDAAVRWAEKVCRSIALE